MEQTAVQKLARVLWVMVLILFAVNLLALFFVPGLSVAGGLWGLRESWNKLFLNENPWEVPSYFLMCWLPDFWVQKQIGAGQAVIAFSLLASGVCTAVILWQGKRLLDTVLQGNPFQMANAGNLKRAAVCCWIISGAAAARFCWESSAFGTAAALLTYNALFVPVFLVGGLLCLVMSALFRQAAELKEDQDLTI